MKRHTLRPYYPQDIWRRYGAEQFSNNIILPPFHVAYINQALGCVYLGLAGSQASASQALGCVHQHCSGAHIKLRAAHINTIQEAHQS
eukprot:scaffold6975_cov19-Tisochrysis_lutea.AAC.1